MNKTSIQKKTYGCKKKFSKAQMSYKDLIVF